MRASIALCFLSFFYLSGTEVSAQAPDDLFGPRNAPFGDADDLFGAPGRRLAKNPIYDLSNLATAKYDEFDGKPALIFLVEQYRQQEKEISVTVMRQEERTRNVRMVRDGKEELVEQKYTVNVPVKEKRKVMRDVSAGIKPATVPMTKLSLYRLDGTEVSDEEAATLLETAQAVFVVRGKLRKIDPPNKLVQQVLKPDTLIAVTTALPFNRPNVIRALQMADPFGN